MADVAVVCDAQNPRAWVVVGVEFRDPDNPKKPFASDISAHVRKLNQGRRAGQLRKLVVLSGTS